MKKAILLVRVSTEKQNFDEQEKQLYNMAITDGFKDNEIIPIAEKESGIKLSEDERKGLNRLKEEISKGGVNTVYVWEVSRIGRKKKLSSVLWSCYNSTKYSLSLKSLLSSYSMMMAVSTMELKQYSHCLRRWQKVKCVINKRGGKEQEGQTH